MLHEFVKCTAGINTGTSQTWLSPIWCTKFLFI